MPSINVINDSNRGSNFVIFQKPVAGSQDNLAWKVDRGTTPPTSYDFNLKFDLSSALEPSTSKPAESTPASWETDYTYDVSGAPSVTVDPTASFELYL